MEGRCDGEGFSGKKGRDWVWGGWICLLGGWMDLFLDKSNRLGGCVKLGIGGVPSVGEGLVRLVDVDEVFGRDEGGEDEDRHFELL